MCGGPVAFCFYFPARRMASTAFCTCRRFSASSKISGACCSNTAEEIATVCEPLLQSYVGSSSKAEDYAVAALTPKQPAWDQGDHEFTCFAQNSDDSPLNNSIKNS